MTAEVIDFVAAKAHRARIAARARLAAASPAGPALTHDFMFWTGSSGSSYVHTIYPLLACPELPNANYILVRRTAEGAREVLEVGSLESGAPSLNLALIRQSSAQIGANEVHVHLLGETAAQRGFIEIDLRAAQQPIDETRSA